MSSKPPKPPKDNITLLKGKKGGGVVGQKTLPVAVQVQSWLLMLEQTDDEVFAQKVIDKLIALYEQVTDDFLQMRVLSNVILITEQAKSRHWAATRLLTKAKNTVVFEEKLEMLAFVHVAEVSSSLHKEMATQVEKLMEDYPPSDFILLMNDPDQIISPVQAEFMTDLFLMFATAMAPDDMAAYAELLLSHANMLTEDSIGKLTAFLIYLSGDSAGAGIIASNTELQELLEEVTEMEENDALSWQQLTEEEAQPKPGKLVSFKKPKEENNE